MTIFGIPTQALFSQLLIGLINGAFYALLSLGLSIIFGLLNIINFAHGALYMMGAFVAYFLLQWAGLGYWWALLLAPTLVGLVQDAPLGLVKRDELRLVFGRFFGPRLGMFLGCRSGFVPRRRSARFWGRRSGFASWRGADVAVRRRSP